MADDKVDVIIAFDPENRDREGKKESLDPAEAHGLVYTGRARYADEEKGNKKSGAEGDKKTL